jgi:hypothetical protein
VVDALVTAYDTRMSYMKRKDELTTGAVFSLDARTFGIVLAKS